MIWMLSGIAIYFFCFENGLMVQSGDGIKLSELSLLAVPIQIRRPQVVLEVGPHAPITESLRSSAWEDTLYLGTRSNRHQVLGNWIVLSWYGKPWLRWYVRWQNRRVSYLFLRLYGGIWLSDKFLWSWRLPSCFGQGSFEPFISWCASATV